jgi:hypothetical protein
MYLRRRIIINSLQQINKISIGIYARQPAGLDETPDYADILGPNFRPAENPVALPHGNRAPVPRGLSGA